MLFLRTRAREELPILLTWMVCSPFLSYLLCSLLSPRRLHLIDLTFPIR